MSYRQLLAHINLAYIISMAHGWGLFAGLCSCQANDKHIGIPALSRTKEGLVCPACGKPLPPVKILDEKPPTPGTL